MPRDPKPWFRKDRDAWFVTINGRRYNLGPDRDAAHDSFHELMLTGGEGNASNDVITVFQLFDDFLEWTKAQRAPMTFEWYRHLLEGFSSFLKVDRSAMLLKPVDLIRYTAKNPNWSSTYQRDCIRSVQRSFRWAHRLGIIDRNPIEFVDKPAACRREQIVSVDEYPNVFKEIRSEHFKELVTAA